MYNVSNVERGVAVASIMITIDAEQFRRIIDASIVKPRLKRELRFVPSTENMSESDWAQTEMIAIKDRSGNNGVLIVSLESGMYVLPFAIKSLGKSATTGRAQPIICDICVTWQSGSRAGSITFIGAKKSTSNVAYLCCADLACSRHVRTKTDASKMSRAQLREDLDNEQRVQRLRSRLEDIMRYLQAVPIEA